MKLNGAMWKCGNYRCNLHIKMHRSVLPKHYSFLQAYEMSKVEKSVKLLLLHIS